MQITILLVSFFRNRNPNRHFLYISARRRSDLLQFIGFLRTGSSKCWKKLDHVQSDSCKKKKKGDMTWFKRRRLRHVSLKRVKK